MVFHVLPEAWEKASGDGKYPTLARQIYYAVRPLLQAYTGKPLVLRLFRPDAAARLSAQEQASTGMSSMTRAAISASRTRRRPCRSARCRCATISARSDATSRRPARRRSSSTPRFRPTGPRHRYGAVLFLEKEGFEPLLDAARIAERYDLAIMSTKGMSVTASRTLVETLCGAHGIPLLILHDFDVSGFTIAGTLQVIDPALSVHAGLPGHRSRAQARRRRGHGS